MCSDRRAAEVLRLWVRESDPAIRVAMDDFQCIERAGLLIRGIHADPSRGGDDHNDEAPAVWLLGAPHALALEPGLPSVVVLVRPRRTD
jgi:hypothetical protein